MIIVDVKNERERKTTKNVNDVVDDDNNDDHNDPVFTS